MATQVHATRAGDFDCAAKSQWKTCVDDKCIWDPHKIVELWEGPKLTHRRSLHSRSYDWRLYLRRRMKLVGIVSNWC